MKYGFIGAGNIATALISGAIASGKIINSQIAIFDTNEANQAELVKRLSITGCKDAIDLIRSVDVVVFAVKPHILCDLIARLSSDLVEQSSVIVSVAAGVAIEDIETALNAKLPIIRVIPNLNAVVGEGMAAYCANKLTVEQNIEDVRQLIASCGILIELEEKDFTIFTALAASSPAFTYLFIDSLAKSAHKMGMNKQLALQIAEQTVLGSAKMLRESSDHPWNLIDKVCTPGGTTIEGICTLQENRFESIIVQALENTKNKEAQLMKK